MQWLLFNACKQFPMELVDLGGGLLKVSAEEHEDLAQDVFHRRQPGFNPQLIFVSSNCHIAPGSRIEIGLDPAK